jgi:hydrocephalus-inducing protein
MTIIVKGAGTSVGLEFNPDRLNIGPVLPYNNKAIMRLDIKNPSDYDTELFSTNFDSDYLKDEDMVRSYDEFQNTDMIFVPVRSPGQPFWENIKKSFEIKA